MILRRQPKFFRQLDDDPLGAADVAEPVAALVLLDIADEVAAAGSQTGDGGVDVVDRERDVPDARGVRRRVRVSASLGGDRNLTS